MTTKVMLNKFKDMDIQRIFLKNVFKQKLPWRLNEFSKFCVIGAVEKKCKTTAAWLSGFDIDEQMTK